MEKRKPPIVWGKCKLVQPLCRAVWRLLKKLKIELPYDPAIPLLGIHLKKNMIQKYTYTLIHCTTVHNSQDTKVTSMLINRGMDKEDVVHIYNGIFFSY